MGWAAGCRRGRGCRSLVAKDMRMTPHQFAIERVKNVGDREVPFVGGHLRVEKNLKQKIAKFFGQVRKVAALDGVEDLVGLFQRVFADGVEGLFAVPGAAAGSAKARHNGYRLLKQRGRPRRVGELLRRGIFLAGVGRRKIHAFLVYLAARGGAERASHGNGRATTC